MAVPSFLLSKLYIQGSLKNTDTGFEFALRNNLAPGSLIGLGPVTVDEATIPVEAVTFTTPKGQFRGSEVSSQNPVAFDVGVDVKVAVEGHPLAPGQHHIVFAVLTREVGRLEISMTDTV